MKHPRCSVALLAVFSALPLAANAARVAQWFQVGRWPAVFGYRLGAHYDFREFPTCDVAKTRKASLALGGEFVTTAGQLVYGDCVTLQSVKMLSSGEREEQWAIDESYTAGFSDLTITTLNDVATDITVTADDEVSPDVREISANEARLTRLINKPTALGEDLRRMSGEKPQHARFFYSNVVDYWNRVLSALRKECSWNGSGRYSHGYKGGALLTSVPCKNEKLTIMASDDLGLYISFDPLSHLP